MHAAFDRLQQQRTPLLSPFAPVGAPYRQPGLSSVLHKKLPNVNLQPIQFQNCNFMTC